MNIDIKIDSMKPMSFTELIPFQGDLKELTHDNYEKLKRSLISNGFSFPIHVWYDEHSKSNFIIDGHQTVKCLTKMSEEGYEIPKVPCVFILADSYKHAKEKLLAKTSQYGRIKDKGLYEFLSESGIDWRMAVNDYQFDAINIPDFAFNFYGDGEKVKSVNEEWKDMPEFNQSDKTSHRQIIVHFDNENDCKDFFDLIGQTDTGKTKYLWFPERERNDTESKRY